MRTLTPSSSFATSRDLHFSLSPVGTEIWHVKYIRAVVSTNSEVLAPSQLQGERRGPVFSSPTRSADTHWSLPALVSNGVADSGVDLRSS